MNRFKYKYIKLPLLFFRTGEAPRFKSKVITSKFPQEAASCRGVVPSHCSPPRSSIRAPLSRRASTMPINP